MEAASTSHWNCSVPTVHFSWLKKHKPELFKDHELTGSEQEIIRDGEIADEASMNLFPGGKLVDSRDPDNLDLSKELVANNTGTIFQPSFEWNNFLPDQTSYILMTKRKDGSYTR